MKKTNNFLVYIGFCVALISTISTLLFPYILYRLGYAKIIFVLPCLGSIVMFFWIIHMNNQLSDFKRKLNIYVPYNKENLVDNLKEYCQASGRTIDDAVADGISLYLDKAEEKLSKDMEYNPVDVIYPIDELYNSELTSLIYSLSDEQKREFIDICEKIYYNKTYCKKRLLVKSCDNKVDWKHYFLKEEP